MGEFEDSLNRAIDKKMDEIVDFIFSRSQQHLIRNKSTDTGLLLRSGNIQRGFLEKTITYSVPYASAIEYGSQPHRIYSIWLEGWVRRKLGVKDDIEAKKVAFAIAKKIELEGIDAKPFLRPSIEEAKSKYGGI